MNRGDSSLE